MSFKLRFNFEAFREIDEPGIKFNGLDRNEVKLNNQADEVWLRLLDGEDIKTILGDYQPSPIGEGEEIIKEVLDKEYKDTLSINDGVKLAIKALKKVLGNEFDMRRIDGAYIKTSDKKFVRLDQATLKKSMI